MSHYTCLTLLTITVALTYGCSSNQAADSNQSTGEKTVNHQTANEIFPEPTFPPIVFTATERPQPKSTDEAKQSLAEIKSLYDSQNIPRALNQNLTCEAAYQYAKAWKLLHDQLPHDVTWLKSLKPDNIPGIDSVSLQQIENTRKAQLEWLETRLPKQLDDSAKYTRQFIEGCVGPMMWNHIVKAADVDMSDSTAVGNLLGRQELNETRAQQIRQVDEAFASAILFDEIMNIDSDWNPKRQEFRAVVLRYQDKLESAADAIVPPKDIGDAKLTKVAAEVLANKKYKLPKAVKIIVNSPKRSYGKDHFTIDFSERSIEKSPYRWEEFQVATIEKEGDQHYLWYNTLLYYEEGPHTVPTKKWVLGPRHKSAPISEKNIGASD